MQFEWNLESVEQDGTVKYVLNGMNLMVNAAGDLTITADVRGLDENDGYKRVDPLYLTADVVLAQRGGDGIVQAAAEAVFVYLKDQGVFGDGTFQVVS